MAGGVRIVQLREKSASTKHFVNLAKSLRQITSSYKAKLIVNDRIDIALGCSADGVHLGQGDFPLEEARKILGPQSILGLSLESKEELLEGNTLPCDYMALSPVFLTETKQDTKFEWGWEGVQWALENARKPIVAIGGIDWERASRLHSLGIQHIAAVSYFTKSHDPESQAKRFNSLFPLL